MISRIVRCLNAVLMPAVRPPAYAAERHQCERGIIADRADVAEMAGEPFKFGEQAQPRRAIGHRKLQRRFGCARKRIGIGNGAVAGDASGR
jgi:hypothetical protein